MKRPLVWWQSAEFLVIALGGTLLHFLYEWSGNSPLIAPFSGVNESTFEHMKLFFWPAFLFALLQAPFFKKHSDFWCVKLSGILLGLSLIPFLFYGYNGLIGKSPAWVNITIFFLSAAATALYEARLFKKESVRCKSQAVAFAILLLIALLFVLFTFRPPMLALFKDPQTGGYGI